MSFPDAVGGVRPLKQDRITPPRKKRKPVPEQTLRDQREVMDSLLSDDYEPADVETGEELLYSRPGLQHSIMRKLRRGQYAIEAQLDLHGNTGSRSARACQRLHPRDAGAEPALRAHYPRQGQKLGRELPVLKGKVNRVAAAVGQVLAFCPRAPNDGGTGTVSRSS